MDRKQLGTRGVIVTLVALTMAMAAVPALAQRGPAFGAGRGQALAAGDGDFGPFGDRLARRLDLSDAQREAIAKIHENGRARDLPLRKQLRQLRHELKGEMMKDAPSESAVQSLVERIGDVRTNLQKARLADRLAVRSQLTEEQRDRLLAMGDDGPGRRGGRHGLRPGGRGRPGSRWRQDAD